MYLTLFGSQSKKHNPSYADAKLVQPSPKVSILEREEDDEKGRKEDQEKPREEKKTQDRSIGTGMHLYERREDDDEKHLMVCIRWKIPIIFNPIIVSL